MKTIENYSYKVSQHIGKGYSSTVHKGVNDKTGQQISIKVIEMIKLQDPINQMLLQYQVSALKNLTFSSNVLHFYDVYATKNNTYIITQLCQGDLGSLLKQRKQFPYFQAVQILKQLVLGYNDIHKIGFLHRDIKPANIFYKKGTYKIGDFGFSIPINQINQHKDYNVGTPVYMPPEALKSNIYNVSSDTWAIGIIFYQLIKGLVPWRAISEQKLHEKMMTEPLNSLTTGLPQVARSFLSQVLNLDSQKRMAPSQMLNWINKLSVVEIRSMSPYQPRRQNPLQQIKILPHCQKGLSIPNHLNSNTIINQKPQFYPIPNIPSLDTRKQFQNISSNNTPKMNKVNFFPKNENQQIGFNLKQQKNTIGTKNFKEASNFAESYINYLKFIHRVIKFIGSPTKLVIEQLEQSTIRHLFKEFQRIKKIKEVENCSQLNIQGWPQFLKSQEGQSFNKKLQKYQTKYNIFHILSSEYPPQVYKQQICSGILKIFTYLEEKQSNYSQKLVIALDYLITFYQLIQLKTKLELKQFLKVSKINEIMSGSPYNVSEQHLPQLKKRMKILNILIESQDTKNTLKVNYQQSYNFIYYPNQINSGETCLRN